MAEATNATVQHTRQSVWRTVILPLLASGGAVGVAVVGAILTGEGFGAVNGLVEALSGRSGTLRG